MNMDSIYLNINDLTLWPTIKQQKSLYKNKKEYLKKQINKTIF